MTNQQRLPFWAGLAAFVLLTAGFLATGSPPHVDASTQRITEFLVGHRNGILLQACLFGLATPLLVWFMGGLCGLVAHTDDSDRTLATAFVGAIVLLFAVFSAGAIALTAMSWRGTAGVPPSTVRLVYDSWTLASYSLTAGASAASVLTAALVLRRARLVPTWVLWIGTVVIAANVGELCGLFVKRGWLAAGQGPGTVAIPAWVAFFTATAVVLLRSPAVSLEIAEQAGTDAANIRRWSPRAELNR